MERPITYAIVGGPRHGQNVTTSSTVLMIHTPKPAAWRPMAHYQDPIAVTVTTYTARRFRVWGRVLNLLVPEGHPLGQAEEELNTVPFGVVTAAATPLED